MQAFPAGMTNLVTVPSSQGMVQQQQQLQNLDQLQQLSVDSYLKGLTEKAKLIYANLYGTVAF